MIGNVVSHYKILEHLGGGGMGVVYRAEDTKLKRTVALKFLPPDLTRDPDAKERFVREAQAASALQHNNICNVHDIDQGPDGQMFIVMDLYEGETLKKKIERGPLKIEAAIDVAIQIAQGLARAHEQGIVHRDIKPANVMITSDGVAKIVDFGLAKLRGQSMRTRTGSTLGTAAYMSPEQTKGESVDHRTDIWSLGVTIFEMVTGQLPFKGDYENAVMYSILNTDPEPLTALRTGVPMELERIVSKALAKNRDERYQHVDDILVDLRVLRTSPSDRTTSPADSGPGRTPRRVGRWRQLSPWFVALFMAVVAAAAFWKPWSGPTVANQRPVRFSETLQEGDSLDGNSNSGPAIAISRDGRKLVYGVVQNGISRLYLRALDSLEGRPISGTEGGRAPFFSPDGNWVGFWADGYLKKVSLHGGAPQNICEAATVGGAWGADNTIVFVRWIAGDGLFRIQADGSNPQRLVELTDIAPLNWYCWPQILPDGKTILITVSAGWRTTQIALVSTETRTIQYLIKGGGYARYSPTGHIVYGRPGEGDVWAVPFDLKTLTISGSSFPVLEGVMMKRDASAQFALSETGTLVYIHGSGAVDNDTIALVNRGGETRSLPIPPGAFHGFRFSPDGKRLVFTWHQAMPNLWIYELDRGVLRRFTDDQGGDWTPLWTPDGKRILFQSDRAGRGFRLFWKALDGEGPAEMLTETDYKQQPGCWTADGKSLIFQEGVYAETGHDIMLLSLEGDRKPRPLLQTRYNERYPALSPDGRWMAYGSDESGRWEVYARRYPDLKDIVRISTDGGSAPMWSPDGRELFFWDTNRRTLVSVPVRTGGTLEVGKPTVFAGGEFSFGGNSWYRNYDISPDGKKVVMILRGKPGPNPRRFNVVLNWFEELIAREHGGQ